jgi:hypothetical protein
MESEGSLPCSQEHYTGLCPEQNESSPYDPSQYKQIKTAHEITCNFFNFIDIDRLLRKKILLLEITAFPDIVHRPVFKKHYETQRFGNWICLCLQVKWKGDTYSVGSVRRS